MDEKSRIELSQYRFERAKETLKSAKSNFDNCFFNEAVSRLYYAIFYALLAITELDGFEASKHSVIISYFTFNYLRTKIFDGKLSKLINSAFKLRHNADYEEFFIVSKDDARKQINDAEEIINIFQPYLEKSCKK